MKRNIGIFIFDDAEVLDFAGPFEVFSVTSQLNNYELFDVFTVAKNETIITAVNGLLVKPNYSFGNHPHIDILIIAGGQGTRKLLNDNETLDWVNRTHNSNELTLTICSGARLLAILGLLKNKTFCTHHQVYEHINEIEPTALARRDKRYVKCDERIYTSGGISAGIDLSLHIVAKLSGDGCAAKTAAYMEYHIQAN